MRQYLCECQICKLQHNVSFSAAPYPEFGESFDVRCKCCQRTTPHRRVLTRKTLSELRRDQTENELRKSMEDECAKYGFRCRFLYESVIITTPLADWCFDYHQKFVTLYHESTIKINFETGAPCKAHCQFRNRKMSPLQVIEYIAAHEVWRSKQNEVHSLQS